MVLVAAACGPVRNGFVDSEPVVDATGADSAQSDAVSEGSADVVAPIDVPAAEDVAEDIPVITDAGPSDAPGIVSVYVYAHTESELYRVNPLTYETRSIGLFRWPSDGADHRMTDIAITGDNMMWGVTFDTLYRIDTGTAACTHVASLTSGLMFNGLSFVAGTAGAPERLLATTLQGSIYRIDTTTGAATSAGAYGGIYGSSGDIVSVVGAGTFATVIDDNLFFPTEYLARIDEVTGRATIIGPTGVTQTWGVGYWGGTLYGFTHGGQMVTIDLTTGHATPVASSTPQWWGAGVTTRAPLSHG